MQLVRLLHNLFKKELPFVHKARLQNVFHACDTAIKNNKLYLTGLGRGLSNKNKTSSNIQKIDRLLGNCPLQEEKNDFYKVMISYLIQENSTPWIHVDWACINSLTNLYVLRASLSMSGRSIVIYEECHPKKKENNHATHKEFLNQLKKLLPPCVKPIIVTDAGFRAPWFQHILALGWDFVGQLRNKNRLLLDSLSVWELSHTFFARARAKPNYLGHGILTKEGKVPAHFVAYKGRRNKRHQMSALWIKSLSKSSARLGILLLIAAIATFAAWIAGIETRRRGQAADFQAHSAKFTSSLSIVFLGREALKKEFKINKIQIYAALKMLLQINRETQMEAPI